MSSQNARGDVLARRSSPLRRSHSRFRFRGGGGCNSERPAKLYRTIAGLREENRGLNIEKAKLETELKQLTSELDITNKHNQDRQDELSDLREVERQLSCDLADAHTARVNEQIQIQAQIVRLEEDKLELQKAKGDALSTAMAVLQHALDEDKLRRRYDTSIVSEIHLPRGAVSEVSLTSPGGHQPMGVDELPTNRILSNDIARSRDIPDVIGDDAHGSTAHGQVSEYDKHSSRPAAGGSVNKL